MNRSSLLSRARQKVCLPGQTRNVATWVLSGGDAPGVVGRGCCFTVHMVLFQLNLRSHDPKSSPISGMVAGKSCKTTLLPNPHGDCHGWGGRLTKRLLRAESLCSDSSKA